MKPSPSGRRWLGRPPLRLDTVDSTSAYLVRRLREEDAPAPGTVVLAEVQTAGRGRQGREWTSPAGNLYTSWYLRPDRPQAELPGLSLVVGLTLVRVLRGGIAPGRVGLKWPNDVEVDGRKVAGILLESPSRPPGAVVVGIGVNLVTPVAGWPPSLRGRAVSLAELGWEIGPEDFLEALLDRAEADVEHFESSGLEPFLPDLREASVLDGRRVRLHRGPGEPESVLCLGIEADGGLRIRRATGVETVVHGGEVHLGGTDR